MLLGCVPGLKPQVSGLTPSLPVPCRTRAQERLWLAASTGDVEEVRRLLEGGGLDVNAADQVRGAAAGGGGVG